MNIIYVWAASGTDPRYPNGLQMYFDHRPSEFTVILTLQEHLGYPIYVADKFPLMSNRNITRMISAISADNQPQFESNVLSEALRVQTPNNKERTIPAGTQIQFHYCFELLYSPKEP